MSHVSCEFHNDATVAPAAAAPGHRLLGHLGLVPRGPGLAAGGQLLLPGVRAQAELAPSPGVLLGPGGEPGRAPVTERGGPAGPGAGAGHRVLDRAH